MCAEPSPLYAAARKRILLAAHRGVAGGNIPCNTLAAYEIALRQGADIVELDVAPSRDGTLFVFHPGMEFPHLRSSQPIAALTDREVETLRFVNQDGTPTRHPVVRLEEALAFLRGRCFVNIDKFWTCMSEIAAVVRRLGMEDQVIVKTPAESKWFDLVEDPKRIFAARSFCAGGSVSSARKFSSGRKPALQPSVPIGTGCMTIACCCG